MGQVDLAVELEALGIKVSTAKAVVTALTRSDKVLVDRASFLAACVAEQEESRCCALWRRLGLRAESGLADATVDAQEAANILLHEGHHVGCTYTADEIRCRLVSLDPEGTGRVSFDELCGSLISVSCKSTYSALQASWRQLVDESGELTGQNLERIVSAKTRLLAGLQKTRCQQKVAETESNSGEVHQHATDEPELDGPAVTNRYGVTHEPVDCELGRSAKVDTRRSVSCARSPHKMVGSPSKDIKRQGSIDHFINGIQEDLSKKIQVHTKKLEQERAELDRLRRGGQILQRAQAAATPRRTKVSTSIRQSLSTPRISFDR